MHESLPYELRNHMGLHAALECLHRHWACFCWQVSSLRDSTSAEVSSAAKRSSPEMPLKAHVFSSHINTFCGRVFGKCCRTSRRCVSSRGWWLHVPLYLPVFGWQLSSGGLVSSHALLLLLAGRLLNLLVGLAKCLREPSPALPAILGLAGRPESACVCTYICVHSSMSVYV